MKQQKHPYESPQMELALFVPSQLIAQSPDPISLPGTIVDPFVTP